jgi:hypothetical protein
LRFEDDTYFFDDACEHGDRIQEVRGGR